MISSDSMRGFNDLLILKILESNDSYGYEISQNITERTKGKYIIKETTLYSALARLEKNGHLISYEGTETQGRTRTYYGITEKGKEELEARIYEWYEIESLINKFL